MISTFHIKPSALLQPYINCYSLRCFNTGNVYMPKPLHAVQETYMTFFLKGEPSLWSNNEGIIVSSHLDSVTSIFTQPHGCSWWRGDYKILSVQFAANGTTAVLGIPQRVMANSILSIDDLIGRDGMLLSEQLASQDTLKEMAAVLDVYFTKKLLHQKQTHYAPVIANIAGIVQNRKGNVSLDAIAYYANMSSRTLERRFTDEVGMPPKLYMRISRFYYAMEQKWTSPEKSWTEIAYDNGYADQAHFIKECREFSDKSPSELFKTIPPPTEKYNNAVG